MRYHFLSVRMAHREKVYKQMLERVWREETPPTQWVGKETDAATKEKQHTLQASRSLDSMSQDSRPPPVGNTSDVWVTITVA